MRARTYNFATLSCGVLTFDALLAEEPHPVGRALVTEDSGDVLAQSFTRQIATGWRVGPLHERADDFTHERVRHSDDPAQRRA